MSDQHYGGPEEPRYVPLQRISEGEAILITAMVIAFIELLALVLPLLPPVTGL